MHRPLLAPFTTHLRSCWALHALWNCDFQQVKWKVLVSLKTQVSLDVLLEAGL